MLNICFMGKYKFEYEGKNITEKIGLKTAALVALLMLQENRYMSREKVIAYLWPDSNEEAAKYNLRYNLWLLKKIIISDENGEQFLRITKGYCGINFNYNFQCDILNTINFNPNGNYGMRELINLKSLFEGDFFEGHYFNNCDDFNEIIIFQRNKLENCKIKILRKLAELYEEKGNYLGSIEVINEIFSIDPYDENLALKVMSLYISAENRGGAIKFYKNFSSKLMYSLGIQPSELLENKYKEIKCNVTNDSEKFEGEKNKFIKVKCEDYVHRYTIRIETSCIKGIDYFWISEVIENLLNIDLINLEDIIDGIEVSDLSYIVPNILKDNRDYDRAVVVPEVRIVKAFLKLIHNICSKYRLNIKIYDYDNMDNVSLAVLDYLKISENENLIIQ